MEGQLHLAGWALAANKHRFLITFSQACICARIVLDRAWKLCMRRSSFIVWRWFLLCVGTIGAGSIRDEAAEAALANQPAPPASKRPLPLLRTAEQIHLLTREEAVRGHRAVIRGVVTCSLPEARAVVLQDSTRGIYIDD